MSLPTPYYQDDSCTIYHGDCRDVLPKLERGSVDLVLTDPPFNVGFDYGNGYDDRMPLDEYGAFLRGVWEQATPLVVEGGWFFVWMAMRHCHHWRDWFPEGWRIFAGLKDFIQHRPQLVQHSWDPVIFWQLGRSERTVPKGIATRRDYHVGRTSLHVTQRFKGHPCRRPIDTAQYITALASREMGTSLDPFMGSGTTLLAAKNLNRKAIGIEIEERYCEIAAKRLAQEVLPLEVS